jgi:hypothetical protein
MNPVITLEMILDAKACPDQVALFNQRYPLGFVEVTPENSLSAIVGGIDIHWAVEKLLRGEFRRSYNAAIAEAHKALVAAMAKAGKVYDAANAEAHRVFNTALDEAHKVFNTALDEAHKVFNTAMFEPGKVYDAAMAQAFSDAFNAQCCAEVAA